MIIFDTETTGLPLPSPAPLKAQPRIIEFAAVRLCDKTLEEKPLDGFSCLECRGTGKIQINQKNAHCEICNGKGKATAAINFLVNPGVEITPKITEITGITNAQLKPARPFAFYYAHICEFFVGERIIAGHNLDFDTKLLGFDLSRIGCESAFPWPFRRVCTVEASYKIKGHRMKLGDLYNMATGGGTIQGAHRAINDVRATAVCFRWLKDNGHIKL